MNRNFTVATLALVIVIVLDQFAWEAMYAQSNQMTIWMQSHSNELVRSFMILITTLGEEPAVAAILVWLWLISANKVQVLKLISMVALSAYIMSIAKIIYEQPRPYQIVEAIRSNDCPLDFGHPSGHSFVCAVFYYLLFDTMVFKKYSIAQDETLSYINRDNRDLSLKFSKQKDDQELYDQLYPTPFFTLRQEQAMLVTTILLIGAHSLNQVLLGLSLGGYLVFIYKLKLEHLLESAFQIAIYKKFRNRIEFLKCILATLLLYFAFTVQSVVLFTSRHMNEDLKAQELIWAEAVQRKCPGQDPNQPMFQDKLLLDSGVVFLALDIFMCLLYAKGSYLPSTYPKHISLFTQLLRLTVLACSCLAPFVAIVLLIRFAGIHQYIYLTYFFQDHVGIAAVAFGLILITPYGNKLLRVDVPGDLMRESSGSLEGQFTHQELEVEL